MVPDKKTFNNQKEIRKFSIGLAVLLLIVIVYLYIRHDTLSTILLTVAGIVLLTGLLWPQGIKPVFIVFSCLGFGLNLVVTYVILFLLFFIIFTPVGLVLRLAGKKLLDTGFKQGGMTYWIDRPKDQQLDGNFEKQF